MMLTRHCVAVITALTVLFALATTAIVVDTVRVIESTTTLVEQVKENVSNGY